MVLVAWLLFLDLPRKGKCWLGVCELDTEGSSGYGPWNAGETQTTLVIHLSL